MALPERIVQRKISVSQVMIDKRWYDLSLLSALMDVRDGFGNGPSDYSPLNKRQLQRLQHLGFAVQSRNKRWLGTEQLRKFLNAEGCGSW